MTGTNKEKQFYYRVLMPCSFLYARKNKNMKYSVL